MVDPKYLQMFRDEAEDLVDRLIQRVLQLERDPGDRSALQSALRLLHTLKGSARMVGLVDLSGEAHGLETALQEAAGDGGLDPARVSRFLCDVDRLQRHLGLEPPALDPAPEAPPAPPTAAGTGRIRVGVDRIDALQSTVDDLALHHARLANHMDLFCQAFRGLERVVWDEEDRPLSPAERARVRRVIRMLTGRGFGQFLEELHALDQVKGEIQDQVLGLRMVPVDSLFQKFQRMVRDLARELGKEVALSFDGRFTEIDKQLLDALQGPLTHLVRNAVDHGIERPDERLAAGKPRQGVVTIRAYHKGRAVVVEVEDDGRGLDPAEIRAKAVARGISAHPEGLSDEEALYLLCEPGFSTRDAVTEISGRGVGLDVVKARVEKLEGSLSIHGEPGRGGRFRLYLPLSLSTLSVLLVQAGGWTFGLPSLFVERCLAVSAEALAEEGGGWRYGDRVLPVVSLARAAGGDDQRRPGRLGVVVLRFRNRPMALQVDRLIEEREVVLKPLGNHLRGVPFVSGVTFEPDGTPIPVLNVVDLHARWPSLERTAGFRGLGDPVAPRILVVDDSITTRHLEQNVLEAMGFRTVVAADGAEAWDLLQQEPVDLVLTDVEMPRMDGLELTRRIRAETATARLPVIAVSNRGSETDREAGFAAGVDAYISKAEFRQRELRNVIGALLAPDRSGRAVS